MESAQDFHMARALLEWQIDLGADEAIQDSPVNRYDVGVATRKTAKTADTSAVVQAGPPAEPATSDPVTLAREVAARAPDLAALQQAIAGFEPCEIKRGARNLVFADGNVAADVMVIGEAPDREEDITGRPFSGQAGELLDKMLAAIDLSRNHQEAARAVYITNVMPWRPPQDRDATDAEIAMMLPFLERHVALAQPRLLILMGNTSCFAALGKRPVNRLRGQWATGFGLPVMPMVHPKNLLRFPGAKREAWADLLAIKARLKDLT